MKTRMKHKWWQYTVSHVVEDMLRYDCGFVRTPPLVDTERSRRLQCIVRVKQPIVVLSPTPPTIERWNSFDVCVYDVARIERPAVGELLYSVERLQDGRLEYVARRME